MIRKIKNYMLILSSALLLSVPVLVPAAVSAAKPSGGGAAVGSNGNCTGTADSIATGASAASNTSGTGDNGSVTCGQVTDSTSGIQKLAGQIVNVFSIIVGIAAVVMIIYGGFRYVTSGGDSGSVGNAKNTLIYAIVGLIIVALAQIIVHFVLSSTSSVT
jgi:hypothetical protein